MGDDSSFLLWLCHKKAPVLPECTGQGRELNDEILIFGEYQNKGYGRLLLQEVEQRVRERGAQMIELVCPDDAHHMHFYGGFGMAEATNLKLMKKRL